MNTDHNFIQSLLSEIEIDQDISDSRNGKIILIKVGGNALVDPQVKDHIIEQIVVLKSLGLIPVLVHGGGLDIEKLLNEVRVTSEFVGGHRKTDSRTISYIEMVLSGSLNKDFVKSFQKYHIDAVGISGKDAGMVKTIKRFHLNKANIKEDLGFVGDISAIDTRLIKLLLTNNFLPVISPISLGEDGETYNVNADMFAGHIAGALKADFYIALSNINGLMRDLNNPNSIMPKLKLSEVESLMGSVIQGGMIPKIDSCLIALKNGVSAVHIANGTNRCELLRILLTKEIPGTMILPNDK
tara:strand:- start:47468 stop:48361 length:894 start_codon:yes stop_codon:yes gene_type:complete